MNFAQALAIKDEFLSQSDRLALDYCERRYKEAGCPLERVKLIDFIERLLTDLKGSYPKIMLARKKQLQRHAFTVQQPAEAQASSCCRGGYLDNGTICPCPKGEPHRDMFRKLGMNL